MKAQERLTKMVEKGKIPHSLLFSGPKGSNKAKTALQFACDVISLGDPNDLHKKKVQSGNHPDIHLYHPEGRSGMHSIESLRTLAQEVAMCPNEANFQFFILHDAERMLPTSSNALLKTFEEPTARSVIILLSSQPEKLLPTILSRCHQIDFWIPPTGEKSPLQKQFLALMLETANYKSLEKISQELDQEKKELEKELRKNLGAELLPAEKASFEKEIEGAVTLKFREAAFSLLEVVLEWHRDITCVHHGIDEKYLFYPDHLAELKSAPAIPFEKLSKAVDETRIALERSMKLSTCLEYLFVKIDSLK